MSTPKTRQPYARKACECCRASKTRCFMVSINKEVNSPGSSSEEEAHVSNYSEKLSAEVSSVSKKRGPKTKNSKMLVENLLEQ
ncbi:11909_t:CDS:2 [Acaulospora morrowiae]|uniref:11909_t:CDS:1 n=1 Tax=Acaulospora morrowiae TaxID=94023 RepID=A0A9N9F817_9GLOM|nr:11909_t:CDS:2 [Acaulospora morrowiae]